MSQIFYELALPTSRSFSTGNHDWCVYNIDHATGIYYLYNNRSNMLGHLTSLNAQAFYFDTEAACHEAMALYYARHSKPYPYQDEWDNAIGRYVYHYYAYFKEGAWETAMDGLLFRENKILSLDDYDDAKRVIAEEVNTKHEIYIKSLTLIGNKNDNG